MAIWPTIGIATAGKGVKRKLSALLTAGVFTWSQIAPALATIDNNVVVTFTRGGNTQNTSVLENVDVQNAVPSISLDKTAVFNDGGNSQADPNDTITYTFRVENTSNVTLRDVVVTELFSGAGTAPLIVTPALVTLDSGTVPPAQLAAAGQLNDSSDSGSPDNDWDILGPGDVIEFTASYPIVQADIDAGVVTNNATAAGRTPSNTTVSAADGTSTPFNGSNGISIVKTGVVNMGGNGRPDTNDTVSYQMVVTNTGTTTLFGVKVTDPLLNLSSLPQQQFFAAIDAIRGGFDPQTTASIEPAYPLAPQRAFALPTLSTALHASRSLVWISGNQSVPKAGDTVGIVFTVINTGDGPLTSVKAMQLEADAFSDGINILSAGQSDTTSVLFTHRLTELEIANGRIEAPAAVTAQSRDQLVEVVPTDEMLLASINSVEEVATAVITPANVATLLPGQSTTFTASYSLKQLDINVGHIDNQAKATGKTITNVVVSDLSDDNSPLENDKTIIPLVQESKVTLLKDGAVNLGSDGTATVGDKITYSFSVSNPGNVSLSNVVISDVPLGLNVPITYLSGDTGTTGIIDPGEVWKYRAIYSITQADINAGQVVNHATVNAIAPGNVPVQDLSDRVDPAGDAPTIKSLAPKPLVALVKRAGSVVDANSNNVTNVGDTVTYTFTVTNPGNVALHNVAITDVPLLALGVPITYVAGDLNPIGTLEPTEVWTYSAVYPLTQANIDAGKVENQASVSALPPTGAAVTDLSDDLVPTQNDKTITLVTGKAKIALIKTVSSTDDNNGNSILDVGDDINYAFEVRNTGTITLSNVTVSDPLVGPVSGSIATFAPGAIDTTTFSASYTVAGRDMLAGQVTNQATVTGLSPQNTPVIDKSDNSKPDEDDPTITPIVSKAAIALLKKVTAITDTNSSGQTDVGDTISYAFVVRNTGNVPLTQVTIADPLVTVAGGPIGTLLAGDTDGDPGIPTFMATYILTSADITRGFVSNTATASGTAPDSSIVRDVSDAENYAENDPTLTYLASTPKIALVKKSTGITDTNTNGKQDVGDVIGYAFTVTNTGNRALTNVTVTDPQAVITGGPLALLGISQADATTFSGTHVITVEDFNAGGVTNQAIASGKPPTGAGATDKSDDASLTEDDPTFTALAGIPKIALVKKVSRVDDNNGNGITDVGDVINYSFAVTNTGNVVLEDVTLTDNIADISGTKIGKLDPGVTNSSAFKGRHVITPDDAKIGKVTNQATVTAKSVSGVLVSDASDNANVNENNPTVTPVAKSAPILTKTASKSELRRGEQVSYTISAANLLTGPYTIIDTLPPGFRYVPKSAVLNGVAATPAGNDRTLSFSGLTPDSSGKVSIKMTLMAGTTLSTGAFINRVALFDETNGTRLARAEATVTIKEEHVFDCGEIIGRVFDDLNGNGYADAGEPGMPGVRVVTVNGLILTSDTNGRFHIACADIPDGNIGSNFILKLDPGSLPDGYHLTTENPRDVRLTRGKVTKLNFGVAKACNVVLDIKRDAFVGNSSDLKPEWMKGLDRLTNVLQQCNGTLKIRYLCGQYAPIADTRLAATETALREKWSAIGSPYALNVSSSVECGK
jgi:uncharacterized repeat protein (TIGR01451 family)